VRASKGSRARLFALIYGVGVAVTIFLSNDATAVVLTPAVLAAVRAAEADPLPYLLICAFIANGASFVLPISNPANLVVYGHRLPSLAPWLATFALPSAASIVVTFVVLRWLSSKRLQGPIQTSVAGLALRFKRREWAARFGTPYWSESILGPNLSVSGSLATILWLIAMRREGEEIGFCTFLKWGALVMPPALALATAALLVNAQP
jgi:Na+/H+ antiporter NhaD/arsenite permease-like protein